jgi:glycosyltransferase involved in cell wall biosynthesis
MAVYNGAAFLREALECVRQQTYPRIELIVVDDGSTDESAEIARSFGPAQYVRHANRGIAASRNRGVELASGALLAFLDQDDTWRADKIARQFEYLNDHPDVSIVLSKERLVFADGYHSPYWENHRLMVEDHVAVVPGAWLVRKRLFEEVGPFDGKFKIADDFDWLMRVLDMGARYGVVEETLLFKRLHEANASSRIDVARAEILTLMRSSIHRRRESGKRRA